MAERQTPRRRRARYAIPQAPKALRVRQRVFPGEETMMGNLNYTEVAPSAFYGFWPEPELLRASEGSLSGAADEIQASIPTSSGSFVDYGPLVERMQLGITGGKRFLIDLWNFDIRTTETCSYFITVSGEDYMDRATVFPQIVAARNHFFATFDRLSNQVAAAME